MESMLCFGLDFKFTNGFGLVIAKAILDTGVAINVDRANIDATSGEIVLERSADPAPALHIHSNGMAHLLCSRRAPFEDYWIVLD